MKVGEAVAISRIGLAFPQQRRDQGRRARTCRAVLEVEPAAAYQSSGEGMRRVALEYEPQMRDRCFDQLELPFVFRAASHPFKFKLGAIGTGFQKPGR